MALVVLVALVVPVALVASVALVAPAALVAPVALVPPRPDRPAEKKLLWLWWSLLPWWPPVAPVAL